MVSLGDRAFVDTWLELYNTHTLLEQYAFFQGVNDSVESPAFPDIATDTE